ncbi:hypothetical protein PIB30_026414 [Stylosanthes scabra]|uniref:SCP domain-containing protein n=1 Tax=Stylosanthes scabra TaxID=79078 RepID=A0ABU6TBG2_9FABA|nr:hypothetical protein [Stylosanthes scabra]
MKKLLKFWVIVISFVNMVPFFLMLQNSPEDYLRVHNEARYKVGVDTLRWNAYLEVNAERIVSREKSQCDPRNIYGARNYKYGINVEIIRHTSKNSDPSGVDAVTSWVRQKYNYNQTSNSCIDKTPNYRKYMQVVWRNTTTLGCAKDKCLNVKASIFICRYFPRGNIENQHPYSTH